MKIKMVWFRNDLRLHDNRCLTEAIAKSDFVVPIYIFDPRQYGSGKFGFPKTGSFRAKFLLEAVADLRAHLEKLGGNLMVRIGKPEEIIPKLALEYHVSAVYFSKEVTPEEVEVEEKLTDSLERARINWETFWTSTLIPVENLPFTLGQTPTVFTKFRKLVEEEFQVSEPLATPQRINVPIVKDWGRLPQIEDFGILSIENTDERTAFPFQGGEQQGLARVKEYIWQKDLLKVYHDTRNGLVGTDYSSKFSAWLSAGCLSPRYVYAEVKEYEAQRVENKSTYWLIFELLWRDFFHFTAAKHYGRFFASHGYNGAVHQRHWDNDLEKFEKWRDGNTGQDFVDANMRELNITGFMSNRGRQNVASFLINDLKVNWLMGAEYFESMLIDLDVCSNYGNWAYLAGVGTDPRGLRVFDVNKQAQVYDPKGEYRKRWLNGQ